MKKLLCILLCVLIAASIIATVPASAAAGDVIYFDASGWSNFSKIYCHIYEIGGKSFFGWQTGSEECKKTKGTVYSYDLSKLSESTDLKGGMKSGGKYAVIFSTNTGFMTYDCTIGPECNGDTVYLKGDKIESPVNSNKRTDGCAWTNNSDKYGPHLALTSIGNIVGSKLAPGEKGYEVIGEWVAVYYNSSYVNPVNALANAYYKFGIKTADDLKNAYETAKVIAHRNEDDENISTIKKLLDDAFKKAYPDTSHAKDYIPENSIRTWKVKGIKAKTYTGKAIKQKISVVNGGKKATVKVTYKNNKNAGTAKMIIKGTGAYYGTITKTFKIKKAANPVKISTSLKLVDYRIIAYADATAKPITVKKAKGKVTYKKVSGSAALSVKSNGIIVVSQGTYNGLYTAKVKVTAKGNKNYKSKSKTVTVQIVVN